jgi:hypothetical protein
MRPHAQIATRIMLLTLAASLIFCEARAEAGERSQRSSFHGSRHAAADRARFLDAAPDDSIRTRSPAGEGGFALVATIGGGLSEYVAPYDSPIGIERRGLAFTARICWHPDHRLRVGMESGWTRFYTYDLKDVETSFGRTDASLSLSAVPLLVVFSMPVLGSFTLSGGTGGYLVRSHATSFSKTVDVQRFSQGWMAAIAWGVPLSASIGVGAELKWYGASEFGDGVVAVQLQVPLVLHRW